MLSYPTLREHTRVYPGTYEALQALRQRAVSDWD